MRKKLRFYKQHSMETCGPACVLMLLDYYRKVRYPTRKMEDRLYSRYRVNGYRGMCAAAVAHCLSHPRNGLDVHLIQSFRDKMDNRDGYFSDDIYEKLTDSHATHLNACKDRIRLTSGEDFDTGFLKQQLNQGKKIILECFIPETEGQPPSLLHWVILEDYDPESGLFRVRDPNPRVKLLHLPPEELEACMDTPIGKICIAVSGS